MRYCIFLDGSVAIVSQKTAVAVAITEKQEPIMQCAVQLRYHVKKQQKAARIIALRLEKHATPAI